MTDPTTGRAAPTIRLQELRGRPVHDAAGQRLGRVVDCIAEQQGDDLRVTALLVGPGAWAARFGWATRDRGRVVRWEEIAALAPHITLHPTANRPGEGG